MKSVGFKEWSLVCDALGRGEQSIILRKGGIAEGRGGFSFRHREFFLFPTFFHEQMGKVRNKGSPLSLTFPRGTTGRVVPVPGNNERASEVAISLYAKVERQVRIESFKSAEALAPLHVLTPEVVRERLDYKGEGLEVAFVRVFRLEREWIFPNEKRFGGCRSWVDLPAAPEIRMQPVLSPAEQTRRRGIFDTALIVLSS